MAMNALDRRLIANLAWAYRFAAQCIEFQMQNCDFPMDYRQALCVVKEELKLSAARGTWDLAKDEERHQPPLPGL